MALTADRGAIIGYFTNDVAIKMLFCPYKAIYIGKRPLPFTPGLIPRNQDRLAVRVSDTIMGSLLTPEELQKLAKRLLDTERVQGAILWLLQLALKQIKGDRASKNRRDFGGDSSRFIRGIFSKITKSFSPTTGLFQKNDINQIFNRLVLEFSLSEQQARQFSDWLLETVLPADVIRLALIDFLTDRNIQVIDEGFRKNQWNLLGSSQFIWFTQCPRSLTHFLP
ncbi:MAG UNVERIFIED_CONTAM: DUF445 family protein [Microcystis novacekii LVE1205-3]|jgi:uncharacterized membrane protein YheB (UPF0754 family)